MKKCWLFLLIGFLTLMYNVAPVLSQEISVDELKKIIYYISSDTMKGRRAGSPESQLAAGYIRNKFSDAGLKLFGGNGFQKMDVLFEVKLGPLNSLTFEGFQGKPGVDYTPYSFSEPGRLDATGAFAGYGFNIAEDSLKWDDYQNLDVKGKWVMVLRGDPEPDKSDSKFIPYSEERGKVLAAKDKGAIGVIFVSGVNMEKKDTTVPMLYDKSGASAGIPVLNIRRSVANLLLKRTGNTIEDLEKKLNETRKPNSFLINIPVKSTVQVVQKRAMTENVIGIMEGSDPKLKDEYLVIGAHWDHLGMGGPGSGSRNPDTIAVHNGADDNASGVGGVITLAQAFAKATVKPRRSIIFVTFAGEETGLIGSKYFVEHPPVDIKKIKAMFNLDMVGRLQKDSGSVMVSGSGTSEETMDILNKYVPKQSFPVKFSPEGFGASDHSSFYLHDIPVFFFTTGAHDDYHTPFDDADKINYTGEKEVLDFVYAVIQDVDSRDKPLTFKEAGPKGEVNRAARFKVTLGILPDFTGSDNKGLRVDGVKKDGPASKGGILKGDIIVAINGKELKNIYEYMDRLKTLEHGQTVNVDVIRNGKKLVLLIPL